MSTESTDPLPEWERQILERECAWHDHCWREFGGTISAIKHAFDAGWKAAIDSAAGA